MHLWIDWVVLAAWQVHLTHPGSGMHELAVGLAVRLLRRTREATGKMSPGIQQVGLSILRCRKSWGSQEQQERESDVPVLFKPLHHVC